MWRYICKLLCSHKYEFTSYRVKKERVYRVYKCKKCGAVKLKKGLYGK